MPEALLGTQIHSFLSIAFVVDDIFVLDHLEKEYADSGISSMHDQYATHREFSWFDYFQKCHSMQ